MRERGRDFVFGIAVPTVLTLVVTIGTMLLAILHMAGKMDAIDNEAASDRVATLLAESARSIERTALDYSAWDAAADALYGTPDEVFVRDNLADSTVNGGLFRYAFVLEADGRVVLGYAKEDAVEPDQPRLPEAKVRQLIADAMDNLEEGTSHGFMTFDGEPTVVGMAVIRHYETTMDALPEKPRLLLIGMPLADELLPRIARSSSASDLSIRPADAEGNLPIRDPTGETISVLHWSPSGSGTAALHAALVPVAIVGGLLSIVFGLLLRTIWKAMRTMQDNERQAQIAAHTDSLTGLANRTAFHQALSRTLAETAKQDVAILYLDLDGFKQVNDRHGHDVGDRLIAGVADTLAGLVANGGLLARLGGDEFALLLTGPGAGERARDHAETMIGVLADPVVVAGHVLRIGASIGIATADGITSAVELLRQADLAMYMAKGRGRNRVCEYKPGFEPVRAALTA